jgi:integrase/recombinase XerD
MRQPHPAGKGYMLNGNPVDRVKRPKHVQPRENWLTFDELNALLNVEAERHEQIALALVVDQPLRASEWIRANVGDLIEAGDSVALQVIVKGGARRKKVLGDKVARMLTATLRQRNAGPEEPLIVNSLGQRYSRQAFSEMIARLARKAGIARQVRAHMVRHTVASLAAHYGASVYEIAEMLNHRSLQTAQRYVHGVQPDAALARVREALAM